MIFSQLSQNIARYLFFVFFQVLIYKYLLYEFWSAIFKLQMYTASFQIS